MARIVKFTEGQPRKPYEVRWFWYDGAGKRIGRGRSLPDRESCVVVRPGGRAGLDQFPGEMVERDPEIVYRVTEDGAHLGRDLWYLAVSKDVAPPDVLGHGAVRDHPADHAAPAMQIDPHKLARGIVSTHGGLLSQ